MFKKVLKLLNIFKEKYSIRNIWEELMVHFHMYNEREDSFPLNDLTITKHGYTAHTRIPYGLTVLNLEEMVEHYNFYQDTFELKFENIAKYQSRFKLVFVRKNN